MGKYLIAFLALIAALSLSTAYGQVDNQQMRNQQANLTGAGAASVIVNSQELTNGFMTVSRVMIDRPGWVVIHNVQDGMVSGVVGFARVDQEMRDNIRVPVDVNASTENLVAELHYDNGTRGCFEFPGADMPVMVNDRPVMVPLHRHLQPGATTADSGTSAADTANDADGRPKPDYEPDTDDGTESDFAAGPNDESDNGAKPDQGYGNESDQSDVRSERR